MKKRNQLITLFVTEHELELISNCAAIERTSPNAWVRRVAAEVADAANKLINHQSA
jgi:uncharacterized protein (DUF1778 family)